MLKNLRLRLAQLLAPEGHVVVPQASPEPNPFTSTTGGDAITMTVEVLVSRGLIGGGG